MNRSRTTTVAGIGPVLFERSKRARHLNISVRPFKGVRAAVPCGMAYKEAEHLVSSKALWIRKHLARMKEAEKRFEDLPDPAVEIGPAEAGKRLVDRLETLSARHGFSYNRVSIRNQKTRWGSCSADNNISLNRKLLRLPQELIDYVIIHELVHTRIKNHSKAFWLAIDSIVGNAKALNAKLNEYRVALSL